MNDTTYDERCLVLANVFLSDMLPRDSNKRRILADELAHAIQATIEDWIDGWIDGNLTPVNKE